MTDERRADANVIPVPPRYLVFTCKLSNDRFVRLPLPTDFSARDCERLCAFLRTLVDEPEGGG